jgi:N-methylhydantoinase B
MQTERAMCERIAAIPDGIYRNSIQVEGIDEPLTLACAVRIAGKDVHIDFEGTSPSIRRGINVPLCYTRAFSNYALKVLTIPELPNNEGAANPISISVPPGCVLNALPPSSTGGRHVIGHFVAPLIFGALNKVLPDSVQGDSGMLSQLSCYGQHRNGRGISSLFFASGGFGALKGLDGRAATPGPSNMIGTPIEIWENETSMTVLKKEIVPDTGGPGEFRGGNAQEIHLRNDSGHMMNVACFSGRTEFAPLGVQGGKPGRLRETRINDKVVHPKGRYLLQAGDVISTREAGGGGFGDPRRRTAESVLEDVRNGDVTVEGARQDYGIEVDLAADAVRRIG